LCSHKLSVCVSTGAHSVSPCRSAEAHGRPGRASWCVRQFASLSARAPDKRRSADRLHGKRAFLARRASAIRSPRRGGVPETHARAHAGEAQISWDRLAGGRSFSLCCQWPETLIRRLLRSESRRAVTTMPGSAKQKHVGQEPKYLEKFIGADDDLEDFEVEPDVFYGVCPPAPISSRIT